MRKSYPSQRELVGLLDYCALTGVLVWRHRPVELFRTDKDAKTWNSRFAGKPTGSVVPGSGYLSVRLDGHAYKAHVIGWILHTGTPPCGDLDHVNGDRQDNRIVNLREVSRSENMRNTKMSALNTSGVVGVCWNKQIGKWQATVASANGAKVHLGYFCSIDAASDARKSAEIIHGYHANHGRRDTILRGNAEHG
jgi:hypothetical protein